MGNCQAAETAAAAVVIHHPGGNKVERIHWPVTANEIMSSNPGHYVVQEVAMASPAQANPLKLLRPGDALVIGHVYRLISFEDVLKVFGTKKSVRLGKLLKDSGAMEPRKIPGSDLGPDAQTGSVKVIEVEAGAVSLGSASGGGRRSSRPWRPTLQSISELG